MSLLSSLSLSEDGRPTFFEHSMASSLQRSFLPAFDYLVNVLFDRYPQSALAGYLMLHKREAFFSLLLVVERHYLKHFNAGFCENFYGLKRIPTTTATAQLSNTHRLTSLLELVLVPYLCARLPLFARINEVCGMGFSLAYLFELSHTCSFSPWHALQRLSLKRLGPEDYAAMSAPAASAAVWSFSSVVQRFANAVRLAIVASAVVFKLAEYYYSNENRARREAAMLPPRVPPPPQPYLNNNTHNSHLHACPLCGEQRTDPALSPGGFCFCYSCLAAHVERTGQCPVSLLPCKPTDIRRLFAV